MNRLEAAYGLFNLADQVAAKGDRRRTCAIYETIMRDFLHLAFVECETADQVKDWLAQHPFERAASRFLELGEDHWDVCCRGGNYLLLVFSHHFAAQGDKERSRLLADAAATPVTFATPFWGEYAKTYQAMLQGLRYAPQFSKVAPAERYWLSYVGLMGAAMNHEDPGDAIAEIDLQFAARNRDKRVNDAYMLEGSGASPIKFNHRKAGLLAMISTPQTQTT